MQQAMRSMNHTGVADTPQIHPEPHFPDSVFPESIKALLFAKWQDASLSFFLCNFREQAPQDPGKAPANGSGHCPFGSNRLEVDA